MWLKQNYENYRSNKSIKRDTKFKKQNNFKDTNIAVLRSLPSFNGICEFSFKNNTFFMLNIDRDDATTLKIIWRGGMSKQL